MDEVKLICMRCEKILDKVIMNTIRTSGKPKWYCDGCRDVVEDKLNRSGTPFISTPYLSVHAANVLKRVKPVKPEAEE